VSNSAPFFNIVYTIFKKERNVENWIIPYYDYIKKKKKGGGVNWFSRCFAFFSMPKQEYSNSEWQEMYNHCGNAAKV